MLFDEQDGAARAGDHRAAGTVLSHGEVDSRARGAGAAGNEQLLPVASYLGEQRITDATSGWARGPLAGGGRVLLAGHGLRLRRLRLRGVSRAHPPEASSLPGRAPPPASRSASVTAFATAAPAPRPVCPALRPSHAAAVVLPPHRRATGFARGLLARRPATVGRHGSRSPLRLPTHANSCLHAEAGASDQLRGSVALPLKQAPAESASTRSLLVPSGRLGRRAETVARRVRAEAARDEPARGRPARRQPGTWDQPSKRSHGRE